MARIGVIGGGAFGTAMACVVRRAGHATVLWAREREVVSAINRDGANPTFLAGVDLPPGIAATDDLGVAARADFLLLAPPAQHMRAVTSALRAHVAEGTPVVSCAKGIEHASCALMPEVIAATLPQARIAVLSGPSFAREIAAALPAGVVLACANGALCEHLAREIEGPRFRIQRSADVVGVYLGGVLKNVLAIACGLMAGRRLGDSARSMLVALGVAEAVRLGLALGAQRETFAGLAGLGDMDLSCHNPQSRNMSLGVALGAGRALREVLGERVTVQEGVHSAAAVAALAERHAVAMPIASAVDEVLNRAGDIDAAIERMLAAPF